MVSNYKLLIALTLAAISVAAKASDPTRPYGWSPTASENGTTQQRQLTLTQIISFGNNSYAIIDGQRYQLGDKVGNYRITAIESQRIRLQNDQQELELTMFGKKIKKRSAINGGG
ncbi:hypothetical protein [Idiomarina seosinensis]|uniref:YscD/Y4YQ C-terminal domain-containing protein n=1 Tax=Idiomarina seosinensis TaxID=281739 RepID=A0A432ZDB6_9GAMM|nr:hypothetical protein [Idiomarina seosinensis]RUO75948.1 hypothetical protein CWI81_07430 [Idiomarina seosinensis]